MGMLYDAPNGGLAGPGDSRSAGHQEYLVEEPILSADLAVARHAVREVRGAGASG